MRNIRLVSQYQAIQYLFDRTGRAASQDIELQGHWGKYLCVLAAGLLENSIREIYGEFVRNASSPQVANYAISNLDNIYNPKASRFVQVARSFKLEWANDLEAFLDGENGAKKDAIDSIMNNRHLIAHGRRSSISVVRVRNYLEQAVEVIDFIEAQCLGRQTG